MGFLAALTLCSADTADREGAVSDRAERFNRVFSGRSSGTWEILAGRAVQSPWRGADKDRATLKRHTKEVYSVAFNPDGKTVVTGSHDRTIKLWDVRPAK